MKTFADTARSRNAREVELKAASHTLTVTFPGEAGEVEWSLSDIREGARTLQVVKRWFAIQSILSVDFTARKAANAQSNH